MIAGKSKRKKADVLTAAILIMQIEAKKTLCAFCFFT